MLSSSLPNLVRIYNDNDGGVAEVSVFINQKVIYRTSIYVENDYAVFYDLGLLVCEYMRNHDFSLVRLSVDASFEHHSDTAELWVMYSEFRTSYEIDQQFLEGQFLTTRSCHVIPRGQEQFVSFFCDKEDQSPSMGYYNVAFRLKDGSVHSCRIDHILSDEQRTKVYFFPICSLNLEAELKKLYPNDDPVALSGCVYHENRALEFYFVDEQPLEVFTFSNAFNVLENYFVFGSQVIKTDFKQKEAVLSGVTSYYNQSNERMVQIVSVPLSLDDAEWLNQFLCSQHIFKVIPPDDDRAVLISDVTSEISNSSKEQVSIKFSWRFADPFVWKIYEEQRNVFNSRFNETYQ